MSLAAVAVTFLLTGAIVVAAGTVLARNGDVIAARTHLGGVWVGSIFLAFATSLPELTTDIAAVRLGQPDLAAGDLFGSSMANMLILALITLLPAGRQLFARATLDHSLYVALAMSLTAIAAILTLAEPRRTVLGLDPGSIVLLLIYLGGTRAIFLHTVIAKAAGVAAEMRASPPEPARDTAGAGLASAGAVSVPVASRDVSATGELLPPAVASAGGAAIEQVPPLRPAVFRFLAAALLILLAAPRFAGAATELATITGLGTTFVGTWLVGISTSLPELVTSVAAVRLGAYDLAAGNLFGSNALNMSMFVVLDAVNGGSILGGISEVHAISALVAIALMGVGVAALVYRATRRFTLLEPSGGIMLVMYVVGLMVVYQASRG